MSRIISLPTNLNFASSEFSLYRAIGQTTSPFTGKQRTQEYDAVFWQVIGTLPVMNRAQASEWQSFLLQLKGPANTFLMGDPDAKTPQGTYNGTHFTASRVVDTGTSNVSIAVSGANVTRTGAFTNAYVGCYIHITGAVNEDNNGTHKVSAKTNNNTVVLDTDYSPNLVNETFNGKIRQNIKGFEALQLTRVGSGTGTVKKGDYISVLSGSSSTNSPKQLVMAVEDAVVSGTSYSIKTEPKLRNDMVNGTILNFGSPKGRFRMDDKTVSWSANRASTYSIGFSATEAI